AGAWCTGHRSRHAQAWPAFCVRPGKPLRPAQGFRHPISDPGRYAMSLKQRLTEDMKAAMKGGDKEALGVIRLINAAIKQKEVDERVELDEAAVLAVLDKMVKQRRDSVSQYEAAGREDLAAVERAEIAVIERYLPAKLDEAAILAAIDAAIAQTGAAGPADMGKLMGVLKPQLAGQADMGQVSALVKRRLAGCSSPPRPVPPHWPLPRPPPRPGQPSPDRTLTTALLQCPSRRPEPIPWQARPATGGNRRLSPP